MKLIRRGPLLLGAAVILPLIIFAAIQVAFSAREQRRQIEAQAVGDAATLVVEADASLSRTLGALDALATVSAFGEGNLQRAYSRARDIAELNPDWVTVTLHEFGRGTEIFDLRRPLGSPTPSSLVVARPSTNLLAKAFAAGIGGTGDGCPCVLAHRIIGGHAGPRYLLTAAVAPASFQRLVLDAARNHRIVAIADREGDFVGHSLRFAEQVGKPGSLYLRKAVASGQRRGIYRGTTLEGFVNYTAFARSPLSGWSAHIAFEPDLIDAPRLRSLEAAGLPQSPRWLWLYS